MTTGNNKRKDNIWRGQSIEYIPLDDLVLWTENPRDPLEGNYTNDDVIRHAIDECNEKQWQLRKLAKEMGDKFDLSELPTVCKIEGGKKYRVYDGNRRVVLAMLRKKKLSVNGQRQLMSPDFPDPMPCNVCDEQTALDNVERKHKGSGSWKQYERDCFMFKYRGGPKTVLMRLEELVNAVTVWPQLNARFVENDIFNKKHLEEMGLIPDVADFGVSRELLKELIETIAGKLNNELNTRNSRNNPANALPKDLINRLKESQRHHTTNEESITDDRIHSVDDSSVSFVSISGDKKHKDEDGLFEDSEVPCQGNNKPQERLKPRTRQVKFSSPEIFGGPLRLEPGSVNNMYRCLEELWDLYENSGLRNSDAFVQVFRMGLRLLVDTAAMDKFSQDELKKYVNQYANAAKKELRTSESGKNLLTFMSNHRVLPDDLLKLLQNGAHAYTSSGSREQALAMSILIGKMLTISHGRP